MKQNVQQQYKICKICHNHNYDAVSFYYNISQFHYNFKPQSKLLTVYGSVQYELSYITQCQMYKPTFWKMAYLAKM